MAEQYTPTEGELVTALVVYRAIKAEDELPSLEEMMTPDEARQYLQEAKNGLAEVAAKAWDEGANALRVEMVPESPTAQVEGMKVSIMRPTNPYRKAVQS